MSDAHDDHDDQDAQPPGVSAWVGALSGSGTATPASDPELLARIEARMGPNAVAWAVDAGVAVARRVTAEVPGYGGTTEAFETLRMGTEGAALTGLLCVAGGGDVAVDVPQASLVGGHVFARRGIPMDAVLRGVRLGHAMFTEAFFEAAAASLPPEQHTAELRRISQVLFAYVDSLSQRMAEEYTIEHDRWVASAAAARAALVGRIIAGESVDVEAASATLGYPLAAHHVAVVVWTDPGSVDGLGDLQASASRIAAEAGARAVLVVPHGANSLWMWGAFRSPDEARRRGLRAERAGAHATIGCFGRGLAGFRRTHLEAAEATEFVRASGSPEAGASLGRPQSTWFEDVELAVLLSRAPELARTFVARELGPLAADDPASAELRATLAAYLREGHSLARSAEQLHVARNTIAYRVRKVRDLLGRDLDHRRLELECALRLATVLGTDVPAD